MATFERASGVAVTPQPLPSSCWGRGARAERPTKRGAARAAAAHRCSDPRRSWPGRTSKCSTRSLWSSRRASALGRNAKPSAARARASGDRDVSTCGSVPTRLAVMLLEDEGDYRWVVDAKALPAAPRKRGKPGKPPAARQVRFAIELAASPPRRAVRAQAGWPAAPRSGRRVGRQGHRIRAALCGQGRRQAGDRVARTPGRAGTSRGPGA